MAGFDTKGLIAFNEGGADGSGASSVKSLYHYVTNDADTVVEADGYFDSTGLKKGDIVIASLDLDGTPEVKVYVVSVGTGDPSSNDVTVAPMLIA